MVDVIIYTAHDKYYSPRAITVNTKESKESYLLIYVCTHICRYIYRVRIDVITITKICTVFWGDAHLPYEIFNNLVSSAVRHILSQDPILKMLSSNPDIYIYIYIKWTVFVNVTTKSAQQAHARMIAKIYVHMTWDWTFFNNYIYIYILVPLQQNQFTPNTHNS